MITTLQAYQLVKLWSFEVENTRSSDTLQATKGNWAIFILIFLFLKTCHGNIAQPKSTDIQWTPRCSNWDL